MSRVVFLFEGLEDAEKLTKARCALGFLGVEVLFRFGGWRSFPARKNVECGNNFYFHPYLGKCSI